MSLDVYLMMPPPPTDIAVYEANTTHNLGAMAEAAGLYGYLWKPEQVGVTTARQLIEPLRAGLARLEAEPETFQRYNAENGWGRYEHLVEFVRRYLEACERYPDAKVRVSR